MAKTTCPQCNVRIVACRRYPLGPLAEYLRTTLPAVCRFAGISGSTERGARCHGITRRMADKVAAALKEHPATIWPEIVAHDIEDASKRCADDRCGALFVPVNSQQKFCSKGCCRNYNDRLLYQRNAEWRERRRAKVRKYHAEHAERLSEERRTPRGRQIVARYQRERYQRDPAVRARKQAKVRAYKQARKAERERLAEEQAA